MALFAFSGKLRVGLGGAEVKTGAGTLGSRREVKESDALLKRRIISVLDSCESS
jgi:hypothetical protein